ncbi:hypothetical protein RHMOL_Rhmol13G0212600 [Rhododendron molle]|nr:hypothetical protein RHMOL_Rhmol13G0212600 [Rhododendron molle]
MPTCFVGGRGSMIMVRLDMSCNFMARIVVRYHGETRLKESQPNFTDPSVEEQNSIVMLRKRSLI